MVICGMQKGEENGGMKFITSLGMSMMMIYTILSFIELFVGKLRVIISRVKIGLELTNYEYNDS